MCRKLLTQDFTYNIITQCDELPVWRREEFVQSAGTCDRQEAAVIPDIFITKF